MTIPHLVVVGFDEIVSNKYLPCIESAIQSRKINGYSVIDLITQKDEIETRLQSLKTKPIRTYYLPAPTAPTKDGWAIESDFSPIFQDLMHKESKLKVYIATELKAHEAYLTYCIQHGIDCLVEKPIFAPMNNGIFDSSKILPTMDQLLAAANDHPAQYSVMTLSRYHQVYNDVVEQYIKERMFKYNLPLTSLHLRHAGGVWNLHSEYDTREDHPYKYGYGMLMHGGYHYVDLFTQFLALNKYVLPNTDFELSVSSFCAYPKDQSIRFPKEISRQFDDYNPEWWKTHTQYKYGETDITTTICLRDKASKRTITLGTISLEQTTPSVRCWKRFPDGVYNKNGRTSLVELTAQLSTFFSTSVLCYDVPIKNVKKIERIDAYAEVIKRANGSLFRDEEYIRKEEYSGLFHSISNKQLLSNWLNGNENRSRLQMHYPVMTVIQAIGESLKSPGNAYTIDIKF